MQHKIFCFREFIRTDSVTAVHRAFRLRFSKQPPTRKSICRWSHQFEQIGCLCKGKSSGRPPVSEENLRLIQETFERSSRKSTRRVSRELGIPQPTVWRVLGRRLLFNWVHLFESPCILITAQRDATQSSLFIILQVHCTCFGCQPHPSSVVHKTVTTASGTVQLPPSNVAMLTTLEGGSCTKKYD